MIQRSNEKISLSGADLNPQQFKQRFRGDLKRPFSGQQVVAGVNSNSTATTAKSITVKQVITINTETFIDKPHPGRKQAGYKEIYTLKFPVSKNFRWTFGPLLCYGGRVNLRLCHRNNVSVNNARSLVLIA